MTDKQPQPQGSTLVPYEARLLPLAPGQAGIMNEGKCSAGPYWYSPQAARTILAEAHEHYAAQVAGILAAEREECADEADCWIGIDKSASDACDDIARAIRARIGVPATQPQGGAEIPVVAWLGRSGALTSDPATGAAWHLGFGGTPVPPPRRLVDEADAQAAIREAYEGGRQEGRAAATREAQAAIAMEAQPADTEAQVQEEMGTIRAMLPWFEARFAVSGGLESERELATKKLIGAVLGEFEYAIRRLVGGK